MRPTPPSESGSGLEHAVRSLWLAQHRARRCLRSGLDIEAALALEAIRDAATRHAEARVRRLAQGLAESVTQGVTLGVGRNLDRPLGQ